MFLKEHFKEKIPYGKSGVYFLYDKNENLLYIGKAKDLRKRINNYFSYWSVNHLHQIFIQHIHFIKVLYINENLSIIEKELITKHKPPLNWEHNQKHCERYKFQTKKSTQKWEKEYTERQEKELDEFYL